MYIKTVWESFNKKYKIIKKHHTYRAQPELCSVKEKRARKQNGTTLTQEEINARLRSERTEKLLLENFEAGDCYLTCTYKETPEGPEAVKNDWKNFRDRLKRLFKRIGQKFKYIYILENLYGGGRPHGHILIPAISREAVKKIKHLWPYGNVEIKAYGGDVLDAHRLAKYFTKEKVYKNSSTIQSSRNLIRSEEKKKLITRSETFDERMTAPQGYHIVDELSYSGYTEEGYPIVKIFLEKDDDNDRKRLFAANNFLEKTKFKYAVGPSGGGGKRSR